MEKFISCIVMRSILLLSMFSGFAGCRNEDPEDHSQVRDMEQILTSDDFLPELDSTDPFSVLRHFLVATMVGDRAKLEQTALPNEQLEILADKNFMDPRRNNAVGQLANVPLHFVEAGSTIQDADGNEVTLDESMIDESRQFVNYPGNPHPFEMRLVDGEWKVDPARLVKIRQKTIQQRARE